MKEFNINEFEGKVAMHCKTEKEANDFGKILIENGRDIVTGKQIGRAHV